MTNHPGNRVSDRTEQPRLRNVFAPGWSRSTSCLLTAVLLALAVPSLSEAGDLSVALGGAPPEGRLVFQVYDDPDSFGRFRDPAREIVLSA
jgi:hypothetical protein